MTLDRLPLLPVAFAFAAGVAAAPWTRAPLAGAALGLATAAAAVLQARGRLGWATAALLAAVAATGALRGVEPPLPPDHVARLELPRAARVEGRLATGPVRLAPDRTRVLIDTERVDGGSRSGLIQATVYGEPPPLGENQRIAAELRLAPASGFRNPLGFDYAARLARDGIRVTGSTRSERIAVLEPPRPPWPARVRARALAAIGEALPPASAALLAGLLFGERTDLPRELDDGFRRAGVYHVLAVSGFNVALLAATVFALCTLVRLERRVSAVAAIVVVVAFAAIVGPEPSVLRAVIMGVLVLGALLLDREASVPNSLALAALLVLALRPGDLLDPGFQLSFAATAGIVVAPLPRGVVGGALGVSLAAQLAVLPITLAHFNQFSTVGVAANLAVVPLAGLATVVGLLAVGLAFVSGTLAALAFDLVWPVLLALRAVVAAAAAVPGAIVHLPAPHWLAIGAYAAALGLGLAWWHGRATRPRAAERCGGAALALLAAALTLGAWPLLRPPDGRLRLTVLDVGQGDAIVLEAPDGRGVLVDAGSGGPTRLDAGERVVAPYLWNRGLLRLAATVVTDPDVDHAGGMAAVHRLFGVAERWGADALAQGPRWVGGAMISRVPDPAPPAGPRGRNREALVLRVDYGLASFLLASDIEAARERALVAAGAPLAATVLKVPHHGSRSSTTAVFLDAVRPALAVISVGARNAYGHPDAGVLERLAAAGARVYRTDSDGAVILETDGRVLTVTRWAADVVERFCLDPEAIC